MSVRKDSVSTGGITVLYLSIVNAVILETAYTSNKNWYWGLTITVPLLLMAIFSNKQKLIPGSSAGESFKNEIHDHDQIQSIGAIATNRSTRPDGVKTKMATAEKA
jgi:hypothetical protein